MRRLEAALVGAAFALIALGVSVLLLELPVVTATLSERYSEMPREQAGPLAEATRRYVVNADSAAEATLSEVMEADAVSHLADVGRVLGAARLFTSVLVLALTLWAVITWPTARIASRALAMGTAMTAAVVLLAAGVALMDFDAFFSAFHGLFFEAGTWTFPSDSVLIRIFPEPFWIAMGVAWGTLSLAIGGVYAALAAAIRWAARRGVFGVRMDRTGTKA